MTIYLNEVSMLLNVLALFPERELIRMRNVKERKYGSKQNLIKQLILFIYPDLHLQQEVEVLCSSSKSFWFWCHIKTRIMHRFRWQVLQVTLQILFPLQPYIIEHLNLFSHQFCLLSKRVMLFFALSFSSLDFLYVVKELIFCSSCFKNHWDIILLNPTLSNMLSDKSSDFWLICNITRLESRQNWWEKRFRCSIM